MTTTVTMNGKEIRVMGKRKYIGAQLRKLFAVPEGNLLFRERPGHPDGDLRIGDRTEENLFNGRKYYDLPPGIGGGF